MTDSLSSMLYAAVTTDRGEHGFATVIQSNGTVAKRALEEVGKRFLKDCYDNIKDIEAHGISVVPHKYMDGILEMPFIDHNPLSSELENIVAQGSAAWVEVFDQLYEAIIHSSEPVDPMKNVLRKNDGTLNWGVILKRSYIDMVPFNCFLVDKKLLFFDQEFMRENFPAKYTIFRALLYSYYFVNGAEKICPLSLMKQRYELDEVWDIFVDIENEFVESNRNKKTYKNFYQFTAINREEIFQRGRELGEHITKPLNQEEEIIVPEKLRILQLRLINLLEVFAETCNKNSLSFYPFYGSLIGTVRGNRVIPWDDDMDIVMPRADYDKLKKIAVDEFAYPFFLQTMENDRGCFYGGYSKLRDESTTAIELKNWGHSCKQGISIDIFPLDSYQEHGIKRALQICALHFFQRLMYAKVYRDSTECVLKDISIKTWKNYKIMASLVPHTLLAAIIDKICRGKKKSKGRYLTVYARYLPELSYIPLEKEDFSMSVPGRLETVEISVPIGYNRILTKTMGRGYMELPAEWERHPKHKAIYSFEISDAEFQKRLYGIWKDYKNQPIIIWGCGNIFDSFMKQFGKKHVPSYIVDFDRTKWGSEKSNIEIIAPSRLKESSLRGTYLIICDNNCTDILSYLRKIEFESYYIYVPDKKLFMEQYSDM